MKNKFSENTEKSFKDRVLECLGNEKPYPWGKSIGLSDGVLSRIFADNKVPTAKYLLIISRKLGKSINWLLAGEEHPLDKPNPEACLIHCTPEEQHIVHKLVEIFRNDEDLHKDALTHNINLFCGNKLWIRMGRPERRKTAATRPGMPERRTRVFLYGN